jgi:hypothetical protein
MMRGDASLAMRAHRNKKFMVLFWRPAIYQKDHPMPILILDFIFVAIPPFPSPRCILALATICEALSMIFDIILSVTIAISLLVYIVIATTPPERS